MYASPRGVIVVVKCVVGTLIETEQAVSVVSKRAVSNACVVDALREVSVTAPSGTVPSNIVGKESRLTGIDA